MAVTTSDERLDLASDGLFIVICVLIFAACSAALVYWAGSMTGNMAMSGGSSPANVWVILPGQSWLGAAAAFMGMWLVMMAAMMLPSLLPSLLSFRRSARRALPSHLGGQTLLVGAGYFFIWALFGLAAYPLGLAVTAAEMQWMDLARLSPVLTGGVLLLAGVVQLTPWKARLMRSQSPEPVEGSVAGPRAERSEVEGPALSKVEGPGRRAWQYGLHLGVHCVLLSSGYMLVLLVTGVMDLGVMAALTAAITLERLAPRPVFVARILGVLLILSGILLLARSFS